MLISFQMGSTQEFWNYTFQLQKQGTFCDMQLCISEPPIALPVHRLVLLASSVFYQTSLLQGDLQDTYYFDGLKVENLQLLIEYCYRQISWSELTESAEAAVAAQTLQIVQHEEVEPPSSQVSANDSEYPEMVLVQIDSTGKEIKQRNKTSGSVRDPNVLMENKCTMTELSCGLDISEYHPSSENLKNNKQTEESMLHDETRETLQSTNEMRAKEEPDEFIKPNFHGKQSTSEESLNKNTEGTDAKVDINPTKRSQLPKSPVKKNLPKVKSPTACMPNTPERSSSRKRKISSKYADYEDVPTFTANKRHIRMSQEKDFSQSQESKTVRGQEVPCDIATKFSVVQEDSVNVEENTGDTDGLSSRSEVVEENESGDEKHSIQSGHSPIVELIVEDHPESQDIPFVITLEPGTEINFEEKSSVDNNATETRGTPGVAETSSQKKKYVKQEYLTNVMNPVCEVCGSVFKSLTTCISHEKRDHRHHRVLQCSVCSKVFKEKRQLIRHVTEVHNNNPYSCDECGSQFKSREGLTMHRKKKHVAGSLSIKCDECDKAFFALAELKSHKVFRHSTERNEACDKCHRTFKTKSLLRRHQSTFHSSERKHMCDLCGSMFKTVNDMKMHRKKHYKADGTFVPEIIPRSKLLYPPGDYECRFCGKVFSKYHVRETHERTVHIEKAQGNLFICTICNKSFPVKQSLMNHIKYKHLPRKYECSACHQKFVTHKELVAHVENPEKCKGDPRETKKPFWCSECEKGFSLKGNLTKHLQKGLCLRNRKVTTNYVVVLQKTSEMDGGNAGANQQLEKIIALEEVDKVENIVETYKENDMIEVELLTEETVEHINEQVIDTVEIVDQPLDESDEVEKGQEIILQQQEDGTMVIPYASNNGETTIQTLNLSELRQAAIDGGGNLEILMPEGTNIDDLASAMGGTVEIHLAGDADGEVIPRDTVATGKIQETIFVQTDSTELQPIAQDSYELVCTEAEVETTDAENN